MQNKEQKKDGDGVYLNILDIAVFFLRHSYAPKASA